MWDVFVSYSTTDAGAAEQLNAWLRAQGVSTFFDRKDLAKGLRWILALEKAIQECGARRPAE